MRKNGLILKITVLILSLTAFAGLMVGCAAETQIISAYDIAVKNGFVGSETEWLESLKGKDAENEIISAYDIAVKNGFTGTEAEWLESLKGKDGKDLDIYDLFEAWLEDNEGKSFEEFLSQYLTIEQVSDEYAAQQGLRSAVSIFCSFEKQVSTGPWGSTTTQEYTSAGSGVIYRLNKTTGKAYIITNYHVVYESASLGENGISPDISLYVYGGEYSDHAISATFVGGSMDGDIAVLEAESDVFKREEFQAAAIADSNKLTVGERAIAVGNPEGDGLSATSGIVSVDSEVIEMTALSGSGKTEHRVIRVDTAINGGNSGGGLYNSRGELIGIVNAKSVEDEIENIGFAIPVNFAVGITDNVLNGTGRKMLLGITTTIDSTSAVYDSEAKVMRIKENIKVVSVTAGAPGEVLQADDILVSASIDGGNALEITRNFQLSDLMLFARDGSEVSITYLRGGVENTVTVTVSSANSAAL